MFQHFRASGGDRGQQLTIHTTKPLMLRLDIDSYPTSAPLTIVCCLSMKPVARRIESGRRASSKLTPYPAHKEHGQGAHGLRCIRNLTYLYCRCVGAKLTIVEVTLTGVIMSPEPDETIWNCLHWQSVKPRTQASKSIKSNYCDSQY